MLKIALLVKAGTVGFEAEHRLTEVLREVPFIKNVQVRRNVRFGRSEIDLVATIHVGETHHRIVCEVKGNGQPRFAREACLHLRHIVTGNDYPVFFAPFVSPESSAICSEMGVGFIDLEGNCRLAFNGVYIQRTGYRSPSITRRELRSLYSPKAERVLRVLVSTGPRRWKTQELAGEAQVSLGQIANVKKLLADREWIDSDDSGFGLRSFDRAVLPLLNQWGANYRLSKSTSADFYSMGSIPETESKLAEAATEQGITFAFTVFSGAARFQPTVRYQRVSAYYLGDVMLLADRAGLKQVDTGANVVLLSPYDEGVLYGRRDVDRSPVVSPVQLYLDLKETKGRGEEAAITILDQVIAPIWR